MPRRIFTRNKLINVDVVILCGGQGARLRKITKGVPKPMVKIGGRPFLEILIDYLSGLGFKRFILATGYRGAVIKDYFRRHKKKGLRILICGETNFLGTGGALKNARRLIHSHPFIVLNGDSIFRFDPEGLLNFHRSKGSLVSMVITRLYGAKDAGTVKIDREARITGFLEKQEFSSPGYKNCGMYVCEGKIFGLLPFRKEFSLENDFFPKMVNGEFYGYVIDDAFIDIGTPGRYKKAGKILAKGFFKRWKCAGNKQL